MDTRTVRDLYADLRKTRQSIERYRAQLRDEPEKFSQCVDTTNEITKLCRILLSTYDFRSEHGGVFLVEDQKLPPLYGLSQAAEKNDFQLFKSFMLNGFDKELWNKTYEQSILALVCSGGFLKAAEFLVKEEKHDPNEPDRYGVFPLHEACDSENLSLVRFLCENGANPNAYVNQKHGTPLSGCRTEDCLKILIKHGGLPGMKCPDGSELNWKSQEMKKLAFEYRVGKKETDMM
jgi:hypothetical protein